MTFFKYTPNENENFKGKEKEEEKENTNFKGSGRIFTPFEEPLVSLFESIFSTEPIKTIRLSKFLLSDKFRKQVEQYRANTDKKTRERIKGNLMCITPSGTFSQRRESNIIKHTELLCIDIDSKNNPNIDLADCKNVIGLHCPYLYYAGLSLSGEGIFLIFRIQNPEYHKQHFEALAMYLNRKFKLQVDKSVKSPVSLRVASYDENPYFNENPIPFQYTIDTNNKSGQIIRTITQREEIRKQVEKIVSIIRKNRIDITKQYQDWFKIGCTLAYEFGEEGRYWFHLISRIYPKYNEGDCDMQYNRCLKYKKEDGVKIATFFYICKRFNIKYQ